MPLPGPFIHRRRRRRRRLSLAAASGVIEGHEGLPNEQILGELLALNTTAVARRDAESRVQEPRDGLDAVELAVTIKREPYDMSSVLLVPGDTAARLQYRLRRLGEDLVEEGSTAGEHDALAEVRTDVERDAFVGGLARGALLGFQAVVVVVAAERSGRVRAADVVRARAPVVMLLVVVKTCLVGRWARCAR